MAKATAEPERPHMALPDACVRLGLPHQAVLRMLHVGTLRGFRVGPRGGRWRIYTDTVVEAERLLRQRERVTA